MDKMTLPSLSSEYAVFESTDLGCWHCILTTIKQTKTYIWHFFNEMNNIIQQGCIKCIKLIKSDSKDIYTKDFYFK